MRQDDYGVRRKTRISLGSRSARRQGTKGKHRKQGVPSPRARLAAKLRGETA